jgi:MSHA pilin protein MshC
MVLLVTGVLAIVIAPRFTDLLTFSARGFSDQARAAVQYAQKIAVAQRRNVCVTTAGGSTLTLTKASTTSACDTNVSDPFKGGTYALTAPTSVTLSNTTIIFDAQGASAGGSIAVTGDGAYDITVEATTGYVH